MKKSVSLLYCVIFVIILCSCSSQGLSNKSIVKAILVDMENSQYKVSIVLLSCEPSSQIAEIKETAAVYTAINDDLELALTNAERQQNKSAFYAQNELLLINSNAIEKFDQIVTYFNSESCARPGMTVYFTQNTEIDLKNAQQFLAKIVNNTQNINAVNNDFKETRIYDVTQKYNSFSAILPELEINPKDGSCNITSLALVLKNKLITRLTQSEMSFALILLSRSKALELNLNGINFKANNISLSKEIKNNELNIYISGNVKSTQKNSENDINFLVSQKCTELYNSYFANNNILNYDWWYEMKNISGYKIVNFISQLKIT